MMKPCLLVDKRYSAPDSASTRPVTVVDGIGSVVMPSLRASAAAALVDIAESGTIRQVL
jgi:hypothetical protein